MFNTQCPNNIPNCMHPVSLKITATSTPSTILPKSTPHLYKHTYMLYKRPPAPQPKHATNNDGYSTHKRCTCSWKTYMMIGRTTTTMSNIKCKTLGLAQPTAMHAQACYTQIVCFAFRSPFFGIVQMLCIYIFTFCSAIAGWLQNQRRTREGKMLKPKGLINAKPRSYQRRRWW